MIKRLEIVSNRVSRVVYFLLASILEGYITELLVDTIISYSEVEQKRKIKDQEVDI